jgi:D-aminopeptidase
MDIENLAKELILKNMTPEQQMAVLESVRQSVANAKEVQKKKIGENVDLVVQALKKIEADIRDRFDAVGNTIEKRVLLSKTVVMVLMVQMGVMVKMASQAEMAKG